MAVVEVDSWLPISCNFAYLQSLVNGNGPHQTTKYSMAFHYPLLSGQEIVVQKIHGLPGQQVATAEYEFLYG
ncbi:hypothetical protein TNCV_276511 [Trichonephila clavipes]|nr:hypothetical protein TNCV_276511 [Trichonephila clavipes]